MKNSERLAPIHFEIRALWMRHARQWGNSAKVAAAISNLRNSWQEIAEFKRDELQEIDPLRAAEELELDLHTARVKIFDWYWLVQSFESSNLADLQLAICECQFPEKIWEIVENDTHSVVADRERFIVCDLKLGAELSAAACLALAGDPTFAGIAETDLELDAYRQEQLAKEESAINKMRAQLNRFSKNGTVTLLRPE